MDRQGWYAARKRACERGVDHAVALDAALPTEGFRHNIYSEVGFSPRAMAGMSFVPVRFVLHLQALGGEGLGQFLLDQILNRHGGALDKRRPSGQPRTRKENRKLRQSLQPTGRNEHNEGSSNVTRPSSTASG